MGWEVRLGRRMRIIGISGNLDGAGDREKAALEEFERGYVYNERVYLLG